MRPGWTVTIAIGLSVLPGCSMLTHSPTPGTIATRELATTVLLHGKPLELHLSGAPHAGGRSRRRALRERRWRMVRGGRGHVSPDWPGRILCRGIQLSRVPENRAPSRGTRERVAAGRRVRARSSFTPAARWALTTTTRAVLTGWSRGAAFSVLVASEPALQRPHSRRDCYRPRRRRRSSDQRRRRRDAMTGPRRRQFADGRLIPTRGSLASVRCRAP